MKSLELCLVSDCLIVFSHHLLHVQSYLCWMGHLKKDTGIHLINSMQHNPPLHHITSSNSCLATLPLQSAVLWWLLSVALLLSFIQDTYTFMPPFPHKFEPFILFASSTCPIMLQRFLLLDIGTNALYFWGGIPFCVVGMKIPTNKNYNCVEYQSECQPF